MPMSDIEIAQQAELWPIAKVADTLGITDDELIPYGRHMAKVDVTRLADRPRKAKVVLVTAINPTPAGEGKTTTSVGLADALRRMGKSSVLALREPSLGPVFGIKGGAAGGGYAQVVPMENINLHFTGDFTPSARRTTCSPPCSTTTSSRETSLASTPGASRGSASLT